MPVTMDWLVEGSVIYHNWWGTGTLADAQYVNERSAEMYAQFPDRPLIHTISNAVHQTKSESGLLEVRDAYTVLDDPRTGWILVASGNPFLRFTINIIVQMRREEKARLRILGGVDECTDFLRMVDQTILWDTMDTDLIKRLYDEMHIAV